MSAPTNGYSIRLVYYGRADFKKTRYNSETDAIETSSVSEPQVSTQNIRIVPFAYDSESFPEVAIYEIVKNAEAPKSVVSENNIQNERTNAAFQSDLQAGKV